jgi:hypothetical protein
MPNEKATPLDGFYAAYFTGATGNSIGMFVFKEGVVVGADAGGGRYDGTYAMTPDNRFVAGVIHFSMPVGNLSITGVSAQSEPINIDVPLRLPVDFNRNDVHRIDTPIGPLNAKFEKIRGV